MLQHWQMLDGDLPFRPFRGQFANVGFVLDPATLPTSACSRGESLLSIKRGAHGSLV